MFELTDTLTYVVPVMLSVLVAKTVAEASASAKYCGAQRDLVNIRPPGRAASRSQQYLKILTNPV